MADLQATIELVTRATGVESVDKKVREKFTQLPPSPNDSNDRVLYYLKEFLNTQSNEIRNQKLEEVEKLFRTKFPTSYLDSRPETYESDYGDKSPKGKQLSSVEKRSVYLKRYVTELYDRSVNPENDGAKIQEAMSLKNIQLVINHSAKKELWQLREKAVVQEEFQAGSIGGSIHPSCNHPRPHTWDQNDNAMSLTGGQLHHLSLRRNVPVTVVFSPEAIKASDGLAADPNFYKAYLENVNKILGYLSGQKFSVELAKVKQDPLLEAKVTDFNLDSLWKMEDQPDGYTLLVSGKDLTETKAKQFLAINIGKIIVLPINAIRSDFPAQTGAHEILHSLFNLNAPHSSSPSSIIYAHSRVSSIGLPEQEAAAIHWPKSEPISLYDSRLGDIDKWLPFVQNKLGTELDYKAKRWLRNLW